MATNETHPRLALIDALGWPLLIGAVAMFSGKSGVVGPTLAAAIAVWAAMRLRRAWGYGRQPYRFTTNWMLRMTAYMAVFVLVLMLAKWLGRFAA
jgi:Kef-type K+ transport system membrane component KefB